MSCEYCGGGAYVVVPMQECPMCGEDLSWTIEELEDSEEGKRMSEELKPCPCCNGKTYYSKESKSIVCSKCALAFSATWVPYPEWHAVDFLIEAFNTRYEPTCKVDYTFTNGFDELETVMECGHTIIGDVGVYCSGCGRKVIEE